MCDCILRDSQSYLDHINGKYHNRALGMSMTVEKSTADDVRKKFESLQKTKNQPAPVDTVLDGDHLFSWRHPVLLLLVAKTALFLRNLRNTWFCSICSSCREMLKSNCQFAGWDRKVLEAQEEEERERQRKKDRKRERQVGSDHLQLPCCTTCCSCWLMLYQAISDVFSNADLQREQEEEYEVDDEMALALGFGGFGSSKR